MKPLVVIESPYAAPTIEQLDMHERYARDAMLDSINRLEVPFAGHLLYTQILNDTIPTERELGISLHLEFLRRAARVAVYTNLGISPGMQKAIDFATERNIPIRYRKLDV